ncbi:MAG: endonuclease V [Myxococcota bacterium]
MPTDSRPEKRWPTSTEELSALQSEISRTAAARAGEPGFMWDPRQEAAQGQAALSRLLTAGCFVCFPHGAKGPGEKGDPGWAAAALFRGDEPVGLNVVSGAAGGPYRPGLLALREGPLLAEAIEGLPVRPDLLLANATGLDHPRRCGLAVHLGWALDLPSVGVTHRALFAEGSMPASRVRGATSPLRIDGEQVARWACTMDGARPLVVHPGWRTNQSVALDALLASTPPGSRSRTPLPIRAAGQAAREARAIAEGKALGPAGPLRRGR